MCTEPQVLGFVGSPSQEVTKTCDPSCVAEAASGEALLSRGIAEVVPELMSAVRTAEIFFATTITLDPSPETCIRSGVKAPWPRLKEGPIVKPTDGGLHVKTPSC